MKENNDNSELVTMYESLVKDEDLQLALKVNRGLRALEIAKKIEEKLKVQNFRNSKKQVVEEEMPEEEAEEEIEEAPVRKPAIPIKKPQVQKVMPTKQAEQEEEEDDFPLNDDEFP